MYILYDEIRERDRIKKTNSYVHTIFFIYYYVEQLKIYNMRKRILLICLQYTNRKLQLLLLSCISSPTRVHGML